MMMSHSADEGLGTGERIEARQDRLNKIVKGLLFGVGVGLGAAIGFHIASNDFDVGGPWSPAISAGVAVGYLAAVIIGSVFLSRLTDEVERARNYKAAALAGAVYMVIYPLWFLLWKGGFLVEPSHWLLFVLFWLSLMGGTLYYRSR